jgi:lipopolysaccharide export LptBFGC system permease protein LptF
MILFRYILRSVLARLTLALPAMALVVLAFDLGDQGRRLARVLGWWPVLRALMLHLPLFAVQVLPVALLISAVLALSGLRQRGELGALLVSGAGPGRLHAPLLCAGGLCAVLGLALGELAVPRCEQAADRLYQHRRISPLTGLQPVGAWLWLDPWFVRKGPGQQVLALELDRGFRIRRRVEGRPRPGELPVLERAARLWGRGEARAEALGAAELARRLERLEHVGQRRPVERIVLHTKLAYPLLSLVTALMACGFALGWRRRALVPELLLACGLALALWLVVAGGWLLGRVGWLSPAAAVWGPLAVAGALAGGWLWTRSVRRPRPRTPG